MLYDFEEKISCRCLFYLDLEKIYEDHSYICKLELYIFISYLFSYLVFVSISFCFILRQFVHILVTSVKTCSKNCYLLVFLHKSLSVAVKRADWVCRVFVLNTIAKMFSHLSTCLLLKRIQRSILFKN